MHWAGIDCAGVSRFWKVCRKIEERSASEAGPYKCLSSPTLRGAIGGWRVRGSEFPGKLCGNFAALGESGDAVCRAVGQGLDGHGRLAAAGGDPGSAVPEKKGFYVVGSMVGVDDRFFGIIAHAAGAEQVHGKLLFLDRITPLGFRARG